MKGPNHDGSPRKAPHSKPMSGFAGKDFAPLPDTKRAHRWMANYERTRPQRAPRRCRAAGMMKRLGTTLPATGARARFR